MIVAMKSKHRVVIVGAGPAGSVCGYLLKKAGREGVIVDFATFPRDKICGGGLTPKAYALLQELEPGLRYKYQGVNRFRLMMDGKTLCVVNLDKELRMVQRKDFDYKLLKQYLEAGGEAIKDSFSSFEELDDGGIDVTLASGRHLLCDYLVAADGSNSRVRRQLLGKNSGNTLWMEQYVAKSTNEFVFEFSNSYKKGYFFSFPGMEHDTIGMGGFYSSPKEIRNQLDRNTIRTSDRNQGGRLVGANISIDTVDSGKDNVLLIGDAGGFANKLTYEGLYYAIATARNACNAIVEGKSFAVANRHMFRRKRKEIFIANLCYSRLGLWLCKLAAHSPYIIKKAFEKYY